MTGIEIALAIFSVASGTASLHSWFTGLKVGEQRRMEEELSVNHIAVDRLSDHILYAPSIQQVRDTTRTRQEHLEDGRQLRALLEPAQQGLQEDILSTAIEMYRDMAMTFWLPETEVALAEVEDKA